MIFLFFIITVRREMKNKLFQGILIGNFLFFLSGFVFSAPEIIKPCSLISQQQAAEILGAEVNEPNGKPVTGMAPGHKCMYYTAGELEESGVIASLVIELYDAETLAEKGGSFETPEIFFNYQIKFSKQIDMGVEEIEDLGEKAFWQDGMYQLNVLIPDYYITLKIAGLKKFTGENKEEQKAEFLKAKSIEVMKTYILPKFQ